MCFPFSWGKRETHTQTKFPRKSQEKAGIIPGQSRDKPRDSPVKILFMRFLVYCFFPALVFLHRKGAEFTEKGGFYEPVRGRYANQPLFWDDDVGPLVTPYCAIPQDQRYPPIACYGVFGVSTWPIGCDPSPFSEHFPLGDAKWRCDTPPPQKGYLSDTCAIPYENKANGCDTPLCDTISKGYCAIGRGIRQKKRKKGEK